MLTKKEIFSSSFATVEVKHCLQAISISKIPVYLKQSDI